MTKSSKGKPKAKTPPTPKDNATSPQNSGTGVFAQLKATWNKFSLPVKAILGSSITGLFVTIFIFVWQQITPTAAPAEVVALLEEQRDLQIAIATAQTLNNQAEIDALREDLDAVSTRIAALEAELNENDRAAIATAKAEIIAELPATPTPMVSTAPSPAPIQPTIADTVVADRFEIAIGDMVEPNTPAAGAGAIDEAGAVDVYTFEATAGQVLFFDQLETIGSTNLINWNLADANGATLFNTSILSDYGPVTLQQSGRYTLTVGQPNSTSLLTYRFQIWETEPPQTFTIAIGDIVTPDSPQAGAGNIETPGAIDVYTFEGEAGQIVFWDSLEVESSNQFPNFYWELTDARGTLLGKRQIYQDTGPIPLSGNGPYKITVGTANSDLTMRYRFQLWDVPPPQTFALAVGDKVSPDFPSSGAGRIESPGATDVYTLQVNNTQTVRFEGAMVQAGFGGQLRWMLEDERKVVLFDTALVFASDPITLEAGKIYTLTVGQEDSDDPQSYRFSVIPES